MKVTPNPRPPWTEDGRVVDFHVTVKPYDAIVVGKHRHDITQGPAPRDIYIKIGTLNPDGTVSLIDGAYEDGFPKEMVERALRVPLSRAIMSADEDRQKTIAQTQAAKNDQALQEALWTQQKK